MSSAGGGDETPREDSFQVTLPSNACTDIYPLNKANSFTIKFMRPLHCLPPSDWEFALMDIQLPLNWPNILQVTKLFLFLERRRPPKQATTGGKDSTTGPPAQAAAAAAVLSEELKGGKDSTTGPPTQAAAAVLVDEPNDEPVEAIEERIVDTTTDESFQDTAATKETSEAAKEAFLFTISLGSRGHSGL